jgi:hypothetical protein
MKTVFKSELDNSDKLAVTKFAGEVDYFAIEQQIGFPELLYHSKITYFLLRDDEDSLKSFCQINENFKSAHIWFGPVCDDPDLMIESILRIVEYYKSMHFWYIGIQPYWKTGYDADYIEYYLNQKIKIDYIIDNENTKSSLEIDLHESIDAIFGKFSKGHKSAIKKAKKTGITVLEASSASEISSFQQVYLRMCQNRNIRAHTPGEIEGISNYLSSHKLGTLLLAFSPENKILGGAVFAYQGVSVRYLLSASDPDRRDLPISHLIVYEAIERAKLQQFKYFDFWGYNHFALPTDQIYLVNRFKHGFGGYFTFLMKKMNISLIPHGFCLYKLYARAKKGPSLLKNIRRPRNY